MLRDRGGRRSGPGSGVVLASVALHLVFGAGVWALGFTLEPPLPPLKVYRVNIVSPPPAELGPPVPVSAADAAPPEPEPQPAPDPEPQPPPRPEPNPDPGPVAVQQPEPEPRQEPPAPEPEREPAEEPRPAPATPPRGANPDPDATTSGEGVNVRIDGEAFPYPEYLSNIALQIGRYFRWTGRSGLTAELYFVIERDGSVSDIRVLRPSGDIAFDLEARAAIEHAGNRRAFGRLPDGFSSDRLPVAFYFEPAR